LDDFDPYIASPYCPLHNHYLGLTHWIFETQIKILKEMGDEGCIKIKKIAERISRLQKEFHQFYHDEEICPMFKHKGDLNTKLWNGKEWKAFIHIALIVFRNILPKRHLLIWQLFIDFLKEMNQYTNTSDSLIVGIMAFRLCKKRYSHNGVFLLTNCLNLTNLYR